VLRNEKQVHERFKKVQESFGKISAVVQENLNGIRVVKAFAKEDQEIGKIRKVGEEYVELNLNLARVQSAIGPTLDFMMSTGMVIVLFVGGRSLILGEGSGSQAITLGTFVAFQRYIQKMVWPMAALGMAINYYQRAVSSSKRLNEIFYTSSDTPESKDPIVPGRLLGRIEFKNLSFSFPGSQNLVLKNINLVIEPGERVAFVGSIGSGKSALLSLVPRLYSVQRGMLFLDGIDIQDLSLSEIRKHIGYVSQEVFLFSETVFENVAFSLHEWSERKMDLSSIESSTRIASVHDEVLRLSSQYQTQLGERGVNLSGGQKQRLTVARAIAKQPSILILDDALSSVDVHTEEQILKNLKTRSGRNTELIAAHRISTVQNADKIVVLEKGEIIQVGTHHQLIQDIGKKSGQYWKVFEQQRLKEDLENYQNELSK
jgi:ATP-binding cassette subfamily B protein